MHDQRVRFWSEFVWRSVGGVSPIFILELAHRDNDENNNCHRQEDINPYHAHIVLNRGIARTPTIGANQHCPLSNVAASLPFTLMTPYGSIGFQEISVTGRSAGAKCQHIRDWSSSRYGVAAEYRDGQAVGDPIVNAVAAPPVVKS